MSKDVYVVVEHLLGQVADISYVMAAAARELAEGTGGEVVGVLLGQDAQALSDGLAVDRVLYVDQPVLADPNPDAMRVVLAGLIADGAPRAVLFGDTSTGAEVAAGLSARLGLPLASACQSVRAEGDAVAFVSQICGGKIMAEGMLPGPTALLTMVPGGFKPEQGQSDADPALTTVPAPPPEGLAVEIKKVIEPEAGDVDIGREQVLVAVGRGLQQEGNLELAEELAEALGGTVCASRPVVDQGWLPTSRLVGKSGKQVRAKLYLALGISGAPEHSESITECETIIAVNTDPTAPIFDVAHYGAETDMLDLLEVLNERIEEIKGG